MKNFVLITIGAALLLLGSIYWSRSLQTDQTDIVSASGLHWHPELEIFVDGEPVELPKGRGIERVPHSPMHTHEDLPILHLEFDGLVREDDIRLGEWFKVWGKDFYEFGENVAMTVNGVENTELENYPMQDGDKIELRYE